MRFGERLWGRRPPAAEGGAERNPKQTDTSPEKLEGVVTDQRLLQFLYRQRGREVHAIATDSFLDKSKTEYNSAWLSRELVQNFVDHNPKNPGTLDGVKIEKEEVGNGIFRFTIEGSWPFKDPTGVISPHSEKPQDMNTAGGNGIGLKQTAIRLMRDFNAQRFQIAGEGWAIDYHLARAEAINAELKKYLDKDATHQVRHDWLLADVHQVPPNGRNAYVIETDNQELIEVFEQLPTLGVSKENPFLKDPDFENEFGSIKWLSPAEVAKPEASRLFINGQVMNYKTKGQTARNYWRGPEGVTIRLNNLDYKISIDRPPISDFDLQYYLDPLIRSMSTQEVVEQIQKAEPLWAGNDSSEAYKRPGCLVVVDRLLTWLPLKGYVKTQYEQYFPGRQYLSTEPGLTSAQKKDLQEQGYILCPQPFENLGMPRASSRLDTLEVASNAAANRSDYEREQLAKEHGLQVTYEDLETVYDFDSMASAIREHLMPYVQQVKEKPQANGLIFNLNLTVPKSVAIRSLNRPNDNPKKLLHFVRGLAVAGLSRNIFTKCYLTQPDYLLTFTPNHDFVSDEDELLQRMVAVSSGESNLVIEFTAEGYETIKSALANRGSSAPRDVDLGPGEKQAVQRLDLELPGILEAVDQLERSALAQGRENEGEEGADPVQKYFKWRQAGNSYKQLADNSHYIRGKSLLDLLGEYNQADIPLSRKVADEAGQSSVDPIVGSLQERLKRVVKRMSVAGHEVEEFEIVFSPTEKQLAQLSILRLYTQLTANVDLPNDLFIYQGTGNKGLNIGHQAIGLHESLFTVRFGEALRTFVHEVAHNHPEADDHGNEFRHVMEALFSKIMDRQALITARLINREPLSDEDRVIADIRQSWDQLRS